MTTIITKKGSGQPALDSLQEAELAVDVTNGDLYTKASGQIVKLNGEDGSGNGNPVVISDDPPASPEEGDLWYSSKVDDEGLYCWDGEVWFEAGGANGADGEDGQDAKQIWSETNPDGDIYYDKGNVGIGVESPNAKLDIGGNSEMLSLTYASDGGAALMAWKNSAGTTLWDMGGGVVAAQNEFVIRNSGTARFRINSDGRVDITGSLYVNGTPKIGYSELISTLVTLRKATMDETQDIRESLRDAIDELVEGFEQEIAAMPAPEISTMPAGDES